MESFRDWAAIACANPEKIIPVVYVCQQLGICQWDTITNIFIHARAFNLKITDSAVGFGSGAIGKAG